MLKMLPDSWGSLQPSAPREQSQASLSTWETCSQPRTPDGHGDGSGGWDGNPGAHAQAAEDLSKDMATHLQDMFDDVLKLPGDAPNDQVDSLVNSTMNVVKPELLLGKVKSEMPDESSQDSGLARKVEVLQEASLYESGRAKLGEIIRTLFWSCKSHPRVTTPIGVVGGPSCLRHRSDS